MALLNGIEPQPGMAGHPRAACDACNDPQALRQAWRGSAHSSIGDRPWFHRPAGRSGTRSRSRCCECQCARSSQRTTARTFLLIEDPPPLDQLIHRHARGAGARFDSAYPRRCQRAVAVDPIPGVAGEQVDRPGMVGDQDALLGWLGAALVEAIQPRADLRQRQEVLGLIDAEGGTAVRQAVDQCIECDRGPLAIGEVAKAPGHPPAVRSLRRSGSWEIVSA